MPTTHPAITRHMAALALLGPSAANGYHVHRQLRLLELRASRLAEQWANGEISESEWESTVAAIIGKVRELFGGTLPPGFYVNGDPRGYALKIHSDHVPPGLLTDWGSNGILAPALRDL